jgi:hypothetical protein
MNLWEHAKDRQHTKHQLRCNTLRRKIDHWFKYQSLYCPEVVKLHQSSFSTADHQSEVKVQHIPLWLPSQIKGRTPVTQEAQRTEWRLRNAQAYETLDTLQFQLQLRAHLRSFKDRFVRGQRPNTHARKSISLVQAKIDIAARDYRTAYEALDALDSILFKYGWHKELQPLLDEDIRDLSEGEDKTVNEQYLGSGESKKSRIWRTIAISMIVSFSTSFPSCPLSEQHSRSAGRVVQIQSTPSSVYGRGIIAFGGDGMRYTIFEIESGPVGGQNQCRRLGSHVSHAR